jgi:hypothetical protein
MSKTGIEIVDTYHWKWILNHDCPEEKLSILKEEVKKEFHGSIGKYLFFSENREELIELAETLMEKYDLHHAKTPSRLGAGYTKYVLCVYDVGPNLVQEMKQYATDTIDYRYWKSDEATIKGVEQNEL